jgi:hypothetical protein
MDILLGLIVGVGLAASCGFRVFVPMLVMSIAVKAGYLELADGWQWIGSWAALLAFFAATSCEIFGYYVPWVDNLLDAIATPSAIVAGIIATAACVSDMHPFLQWGTAIIAGGGVAGTVQSGTILVRGLSSATTGGLGNFIVSTVEWFLALLIAMLAIIVPILALMLLGVIAFFTTRLVLHWRRKPGVA